jgi:hypothetical protein
MKKYAVISMILLIAAIACFVLGIISFGGAFQVDIGSVCVSAGFVFLGVGIYLSRKVRKNDENDKEGK